jgi:hypothetical protein
VIGIEVVCGEVMYIFVSAKLDVILIVTVLIGLVMPILSVIEYWKVAGPLNPKVGVKMRLGAVPVSVPPIGVPTQ